MPRLVKQTPSVPAKGLMAGLIRIDGVRHRRPLRYGRKGSFSQVPALIISLRLIKPCKLFLLPQFGSCGFAPVNVKRKDSIFFMPSLIIYLYTGNTLCCKTQVPTELAFLQNQSFHPVQNPIACAFRLIVHRHCHRQLPE